MNQLVQPVWNRCSDNDRLSSLAASHPHDEALQDAYRAHFQLGLGVGDYMTYLTNVAFGRTGTSILYRAEREIAQGRTSTRRALAELS